jgi:hypothetical protein
MEPAQARSFSDLVNLTQNAGGIASYNCAFGDILGHQTSGTDYCPLANRHPAQDRDAGADRGPSLHRGRDARPISLGLKLALGVRRTRETVVDESHSVTDEHFIFKRHAFANESVTRDFASVSNPHTLLDFHEGADRDVIADFTSVEIGKGGQLDSFSKLHIRSDAPKGLVWNVHSSHGQDASATRDWNAFVAIAIPVAMPVPTSIAIDAIAMVAVSRGY